MKSPIKKTVAKLAVFILAINFASASDTFEDPNLCDVCWEPVVKNKGVFQGIERCPNGCNNRGEIVSAATFQREYGRKLKVQLQGCFPNRTNDSVADVNKLRRNLKPMLQAIQTAYNLLKNAFETIMFLVKLLPKLGMRKLIIFVMTQTIEQILKKKFIHGILMKGLKDCVYKVAKNNTLIQQIIFMPLLMELQGFFEGLVYLGRTGLMKWLLRDEQKNREDEISQLHVYDQLNYSLTSSYVQGSHSCMDYMFEPIIDTIVSEYYTLKYIIPMFTWRLFLVILSLKYLLSTLFKYVDGLTCNIEWKKFRCDPGDKMVWARFGGKPKDVLSLWKFLWNNLQKPLFSLLPKMINAMIFAKIHVFLSIPRSDWQKIEQERAFKELLNNIHLTGILTQHDPSRTFKYVKMYLETYEKIQKDEKNVQETLRNVNLFFPHNDEPFLRFENLKPPHGNLKDVPLNWEFEKGDTVFVYGDSGSGKTQLFESIALIQKPKAGKIFLQGNNTLEMSHDEFKRRVQFVKGTEDFANFSSLFQTLFGKTTTKMNYRLVKKIVKIFQLEKTCASQVGKMKEKLKNATTEEATDEIKNDLEHMFDENDLANMNLEEITRKVNKLAETNPIELAMNLHFGLEQLHDGQERKSHFSDGEKQRVALARAFAQHLKEPPMVAVFDESFSRLDPDKFAKMYDFLRTAWKDSVFIIASHNAEHLKHMSGGKPKNMKPFELIHNETPKGKMYHFQIYDEPIVV